MRILLVLVAVVMAAPAAADPAPVKAKAAAVEAAPARRAVAAREKARRHPSKVATIVVSTEAPHPGVLIVDPGARAVVGRPPRADRLADLPRHLP
jgi:hypothetical protein